MNIRPHAPQPSEEQSRLIRELEGPTVLAAMLTQRLRLNPPLTPQAVSMWHKRGIPYRYRAILASEAGMKGIEVPSGFLTGEPPAGAEETPAALQGSA